MGGLGLFLKELNDPFGWAAAAFLLLLAVTWTRLRTESSSLKALVLVVLFAAALGLTALSLRFGTPYEEPLGKWEAYEQRDRRDPCNPLPRYAGPLELSLDADQVESLGDDDEISSGDYIQVEIGYAPLEVREDSVRLHLTWVVREGSLGEHRSGALGDTSFRSEETFTLFQLHRRCRRLRIAELSIPTAGAQAEQRYEHPVGDFQWFPQVGILHEIQVRIDADGGEDDEVQALKMVVPRFQVRLRELPAEGLF